MKNKATTKYLQKTNFKTAVFSQIRLSKKAFFIFMKQYYIKSSLTTITYSFT